MTTYTNSPLVDCTKLSPNHSGQRTHNIDRITPHCVVGQCSAETIGEIFEPVARQASSNYGIGYDGRVGMYVEEKNRSWCSSSRDNDQRAITIEVASDSTHPYAMNDKAYNKLVDLCVDICQRNEKSKLIWINDKAKALSYEPADDEMIITAHRWFANTACPGDWLYNRLGDLAKAVTNKLNGIDESIKTTYKVQSGAFSVEQNAKNLADKLKADGFEIYIVKESELWKVQTGSYSNKDNAQAQLTKLKNKGYDAIIKTVTTLTVTEECTKTEDPKVGVPKIEEPKIEEPKVDVVKIEKGDTVIVKSGAKTYNGVRLASFVYKTNYIVLEQPKGDRVVIGTDKYIIAAVKADDLNLVKKANGANNTNKPTNDSNPEFHKGDKVIVNQGAKTYTGVKLASFVYRTTYKVLEEPKGDRVVIGTDNCIIAAVNAKDLKHK